MLYDKIFSPKNPRMTITKILNVKVALIWVHYRLIWISYCNAVENRFEILLKLNNCNIQEF